MKKASAALAALVTALSGVLQAVPAVTAYAAGSSENNYTYDGYTVSYRVADAWGDTERIAVTLTNTGADTLENWMLYFRPNGTAYGFNGIQKAYTAAEIAYFRNAGYNDSLAPGESTTFEYLVDHCEAAPARFSLCQTRTEKTGGYEVSLSSYSAWGSNFNGVIHIHNTSDQPISAWELTFDTNYTITAIPNSWAAEVTSLGVGRYLMKGIYNDVIAPGETLELGFIAEKNGTPVLDSYSLTEVTADEAYLHQLALGGQYSISDLEDMNADSVYPLEIEQDDDGTVSVIDGKFSDVTVTDGESAKDSLTGVQELLGIGSISSELALDWIYEDPDGDFKSYYFNQVYQGVPVFGRTVTVVVGSSGETLSVDCGYEPINGLSADWVYSAETVAAALDADTAEACIYANGAYADAPVPAYLVMNNVMRSVVSAADMQVLYQKPVVYEYGTNDYSDYDMDFEYPDKPGKYFHRAPSFWKEPVPDEASARALALSQPLAVDFSDASPMNTLSAYSHFQYTNYEKAYHFDQRFNSVLVYGREVLVAARKSDNKLYSFESNVVEIPEDFSTMPSQELIDRKGGRTAFLVIYTWDENENDAPPQLAYIYKDEDNKHTHIILEDDEWVKDLGVGLDEGRCVNIGTEDEPDYQPRPMKLHYFPITKVTEVSGRGLYKMSVLKEELGIDDGGKQLKIEMRLAGDTAQNDMTTSTIRTDHTNMDNAYFYAPQAVSAYVNLIQISKWYAFSPGIRRAVYTDRSKSNLNINKGDIVCAIDSVYDPKEDTAYANYMYMCTGVKRHMPYTYGVSAIVLGHEFTHGVFGTFCDFDAYYFTARGINEGYADVFGELIGENWDSGYEAKGNYAVTDGRSGRSAVFHGADLNDAFYDESYQLVPHIVKPAYLLETEYGFTKRMIAALYYKSLSMGSYLDGAKQDPEDENALPIREGRGSTLNSFRSRLLRAAKASKYTNQMMQSLVSAFNEAWGTARFFYETDLNLVDAETNEPIDPAQATVRFHPYDETISYDTPWSVHGKYSFIEPIEEVIFNSIPSSRKFNTIGVLSESLINKDARSIQFKNSLLLIFTLVM